MKANKNKININGFVVRSGEFPYMFYTRSGKRTSINKAQIYTTKAKAASNCLSDDTVVAVMDYFKKGYIITKNQILRVNCVGLDNDDRLYQISNGEYAYETFDDAFSLAISVVDQEIEISTREIEKLRSSLAFYMEKLEKAQKTKEDLNKTM
jgi:hypothetical protein